MNGEAKHIFCVIESGSLEETEELQLIPYLDLAAVVRDTSLPAPPIAREQLVGHLRVIEQVMSHTAVVPVGFGAIAESEQEVRERLLVPCYDQLRGLLAYLHGKVELGLKVMWREMDSVFAAIVAEREDISALRAWIAARPAANTRQQRIQIGQMVAEALEEKRAEEAGAIMAVLAPLATEVCAGKLLGDKMILNAAFLVERPREAEFDAGVARLGQEYEDRWLIRYVGPVPPFNFVGGCGVVAESQETRLTGSR
jgi:hypothetical protein